MYTIKEIQDEQGKGINSIFNACMYKAECCERKDEITKLQAENEALQKDARSDSSSAICARVNSSSFFTPHSSSKRTSPSMMRVY